MRPIILFSLLILSFQTASSQFSTVVINGQTFFTFTREQAVAVIDSFKTLSSCRAFSDSLSAHNDSLEKKMGRFREKLLNSERIIAEQDTSIKQFQQVVNLNGLMLSDCNNENTGLRHDLKSAKVFKWIWIAVAGFTGYLIGK